jgi:hypothetical protein
MTPPQTYLILIKDAALALAVGEALEDRLLQDGHRAVALVPAVRGASFADTGDDWLQEARRLDPGMAYRPPHLVAVYEDGMLQRLEPLQLATYVGVPNGQDWRFVPWGQDCGAMLLPVSTARDMVSAVAAHTPWPRATKLTADAAFRRRSEASWAWRGSAELSSKIAAASHGRPIRPLGGGREVGGITGSG